MEKLRRMMLRFIAKPSWSGAILHSFANFDRKLRENMAILCENGELFIAGGICLGDVNDTGNLICWVLQITAPLYKEHGRMTIGQWQSSSASTPWNTENCPWKWWVALEIQRIAPDDLRLRARLQRRLCRSGRWRRCWWQTTRWQISGGRWDCFTVDHVTWSRHLKSLSNARFCHFWAAFSTHFRLNLAVQRLPRRPQVW